MLRAAADYFRDSIPALSLGLTPVAFHVNRYPTRKQRFGIRVVLALGGLLSPAEEPTYLLDAV